MATKRVRSVDEEVDQRQQEEESRPEKQQKLDDEQEPEDEDEDEEESGTEDEDEEEDEDEDEDEPGTDSKDNHAKGDKEKAVEVSKAVVVVEKKPLFNRVWSLEDEIVILQSLIDFKEDNNKNHQDDFFSFVKGKLEYTNCTKAQVMDKVQKLKKKFRSKKNKSSFAGKDPGELKCFELSKRIWGHLDANNNSSNAKVQDNFMRVDNKKKKGVSEENDLEHLYPFLMEGFEVDCLSNVTLLKGFKPYLRHIDSGLLQDWEREWKEVRLAETDAYIRRLTLVRNQTTWFRNQLKD